MEKILGIDLGTNSIGWAIREINPNLENQIIDNGVLTFDKGVAEDKTGEHPMVQKRTESRSKRRNYQAEKYRKWALLECLIKENMCPLTIDELNEWRHYRKGIGRKYPQKEEFINWLRYDFDGDGKPDFERLGFSKHESYYLFRVLIIDGNKTELFKQEPHIVGRVLYQLVQRRGFNDGEDIDEKEKDELSKTIMMGGGETGAAGVNEISPYLEKYKTLGAALYYMQKEQNVRIRKRYNLRSDYKKEIEEICRIQGLEHLLKEILSAIIWQRPLRGQKGLVGVCTFERNKKRCPISHPLYEEFRTWVFINNLKIKPISDDILQNEEQKKKKLLDVLHHKVYPQFLKSSDFKLSTIAKEIKKEGYEITAKFPVDTRVINVSFLHKMREVFGVDWPYISGWDDLLKGKNKQSGYNVEDLWHLHFVKKANRNTGETPADFIKKFAIEKLHLEYDAAEAFLKISLQQGYATLSISAIKKILPYLHRGYLYSEAVYLANLPKVMGQEKLNDGDIENYAAIIGEVVKKDKQERRKTGIVNELITLYFENSESFEVNKRALIEKQIIDSFGQATWAKFSAQTQINIENEIIQEINSFLASPKTKPENHYRKTSRLHDKIFKTLMDDYGIPAENIKYLWHPSEQEIYDRAIEKGGKEYLGSPEPMSKGFKNPMALKTLHQLKKLINYLIETEKIDRNTRIVIEIARELNDTNKRKAIERWQRDRERENEEFAKAIIGTAKLKYPDLDETKPEVINKFRLWFEQTENPAETWKQVSALKDDIKKMRLWQEQKGICIYTGKTISVSELFNASKYDFEHTIPASMSFDNELKNLTIADQTYNRQIKVKRLPSECPNYETEATINGITYPAILTTMQSIFGRITETEKKIKGKVVIEKTFEKIEHFQKLYDRCKYFSKIAQTKDAKDKNIIDKHIAKMHLDYWKYKLQTFTTKEYKAGWRNSQLKDTQTITKYALPYLKTVFNNVEVQKGNITADFRKIYKIQSRLEKKERNKHSHHAIDAAVLTLIPPASIRDKILLRYNEANENQQAYHETPRSWNNFHQKHILSIEDEILINYQAQHRTLTPTYKTVRKRGKVQYVKEKLPNGKWQYKLDANGKKIPLIAKGDSIRGQLHKESFFGAIKIPIYEEKNGKFIPLNDGQGNLLFQQNEKRGDELFIVEREIDLTKFSKLTDFEIVIDPNLKSYLMKEIDRRLKSGKSFAQAILEPIYAFGKEIDKNGNPIRPIRHVRVRAKGGGAFITNPTLVRKKSSYLSERPYKNVDYALNGEIPLCVLYQEIMNSKTERYLQPFSIIDLANAKAISFMEAVPANVEKKIGKQTFLLPLYSILMNGKKVIFFERELHELKALNNADLSKRMYLVGSFEDGRINFKHHICSLSEDAIKVELKRMGASDKGSSNVNFEKPFPKLRLSQSALNMAIEDKHFKIKPDGEVMWML